MRALRKSMFLSLIATGLGASAEVGQAVPTVDLSWHACSPIVTAVTNPQPVPLRLVTSVVGQTAGHQGWGTFINVYSLPPEPLADAWRFDLAGCQTFGLIELRTLPPVDLAAACPPFSGSAPGFGIKDYTYDSISRTARITLAWSYPAGFTSPDPARRYFLGSALFDHTYSVVGPGTPGLTCGGFEQDLFLTFQPLCLGCQPYVRWLDLQGFEHSFAIGNGTVTFCGSCAPTPAVPATWGAIKGVYRR